MQISLFNNFWIPILVQYHITLYYYIIVMHARVHNIALGTYYSIILSIYVKQVERKPHELIRRTHLYLNTIVSTHSTL